MTRRVAVRRKAATTLEPIDPASTAAVIDPLEVEVRRWLSEIVAECLPRKERLTKKPAFERALQQFPQINWNWFEERIYKPPTVPEEWTRRGRPTGSRNK